MAALTESRFAEWLEGYARAGQEHDARFAAELFSEDAQYYETPFAEPLAGRQAIFDYWSRAVQTAQETRSSCQALAVNGQLGVARWQATITRKGGGGIALDGVLAAEFDQAGLCRVFREWWRRREVEAGPAAG